MAADADHIFWTFDAPLMSGTSCAPDPTSSCRNETIVAIQSMYDASRHPGPAALRARLGKATHLWEAVIGLARARSPQLVEAWHFAGLKVGWTLRLVAKARILVYLLPEEGTFRMGIVLGKKAVATAREAGLSSAATAILDAAPIYAEGHGVRFHVASRDDVRTLAELLAIKVPASPAPPRRHKDA
jgi:Protein of unknown function (DUF3788)